MWYHECYKKSVQRAVRALAGWLSWLEHFLVHQKVAGLIPTQGTCLHCGFDPLSGCLREATNQSFSLTLMPLSLSLSLSSLSSLHEINKHILGWGLKKETKSMETGRGQDLDEGRRREWIRHGRLLRGGAVWFGPWWVCNEKNKRG